MLIRASSERSIGKCITILLDEVDYDVQEEKILKAIGSANSQEGYPPRVRCGLSVVNIRKLRDMFPDMQVDMKHETTKTLLWNLREAQDIYEIESKLGDQAKKGKRFGPPYEFKLPPFEHQKLGWSFLHAMTNPALLGDCGVGKTFIAGTWADSLVKAKASLMFLVLCPVSIIKHAWMADLAKFTDLKATRLHEPSKYKTKEKRAARFAEDSDIYIINPIVIQSRNHYFWR